MRPARARLAAWTVCLASWTAAFAMACRLVPARRDYSPLTDGLTVRLLGSSRTILSERLYEQADVFFHKGLGRFHERGIDDAFQKVLREIAPDKHKHLHGAEVREIMPWLYYACKADPGNVEPFLVAAFWLATDMKQPEAAERVLAEARLRNPHDYRVQLERGRLFVRRGKNDEARAAFEAALRLWPRQGPPAHGETPEDVETQQRIDKAEIQAYLGLLAEKRGDKAAAAAAYGHVLDLFPGRDGIRQRLMELDSGEAPAVSAGTALKRMTESRRHICEHEEDGGEHEH